MSTSYYSIFWAFFDTAYYKDHLCQLHLASYARENNLLELELCPRPPDKSTNSNNSITSSRLVVQVLYQPYCTALQGVATVHIWENWANQKPPVQLSKIKRLFSRDI